MTPKPVKASDLADILDNILGPQALVFEHLVFNSLNEMDADYNGGLWTGYNDPDHKVFFLAPPDGTYHLQVTGNFFEGTVDAETAGIIASLVAWNKLVWKTRNPEHGDRFHALRHYALEHRNADTIMQAID